MVPVEIDHTRPCSVLEWPGNESTIHVQDVMVPVVIDHTRPCSVLERGLICQASLCFLICRLGDIPEDTRTSSATSSRLDDTIRHRTASRYFA